MMRNNNTQSVARALCLLDGILDDQGQSSLRTIALGQGLAVATAYRLAATLVAARYVIPVGRGRHLPGPALVRHRDGLSLRPALLALGRPVVQALARATGGVAHLGVMDDEMVTYLIKAGRQAGRVFTEEGSQLEAYCSGIGKVLLASLPAPALAAYLATGPFVPLTLNTITDPDALRTEIATVRDQGFARDDEEIAPGLRCLAVGVTDGDGQALAALSVSYLARDNRRLAEPALHDAVAGAARRLEQALFGGEIQP